MALTTRCLLGFMCGMLGPIKAYATEIVRKEYNHIALAVVSSSRCIYRSNCWTINWWLSCPDYPADKYPGMFSENSIFGRFPYFLPCLCVSVLSVIALIACFWLPETLHKHTEGTVSIATVEECLAGTDGQENGDVLGGGRCLRLFTNWPLMSAVTLYCIFSFQDMAYAEVFSLWAVSDKAYGGLSFSSTDVGNVLANSVRVAAILMIPLLASYPFMPALSGFSLQLVVNCASFLKNTFTVTTMIVCNILMNDAVTQDVRASANGIAITLMSISKAFAPATAGIIFSWAQRRQTASFLPGDHLVFLMLNVFTFIGLVFTFRPFYAGSKDT
ncbi:hypothetical protein ACP70R_031444 [Stipagrostis hirtigluma subsp. patula]